MSALERLEIPVQTPYPDISDETVVKTIGVGLSLSAALIAARRGYWKTAAGLAVLGIVIPFIKSSPEYFPSPNETNYPKKTVARINELADARRGIDRSVPSLDK